MAVHTIGIGTAPVKRKVPAFRGIVLPGLLIGVTFTSSIFYSLHALGAGGKRTGIHEGIIGSGVFVGPLVGGLVAEYVGARAPYLVAIGVLCCALALEVYLAKRTRH